MATALTSNRRVGDVVKYETLADKGHCRKEATVNVTAAFQNGTVIKNDGDDTFSILATADVATLGTTEVGIVVDDVVYDGTTGDRTITVMTLHRQGEAGIAWEALSFADTIADEPAVIAALEARGFNVLTQV